jgi:dihydrofolate reductase
VIRLIAAIDETRGLSTDTGIPWHLPGDVAHFRQLTANGAVLMGRATYDEFAAPLPDRQNLVLTRSPDGLRAGFQGVDDLDGLLANQGGSEKLWVIGGSAVYAETIDRAEELSLTRVAGDFDCTKFFPPFEADFDLVDQGEVHRENGVAYRFETWRRPPGRGDQGQSLT